jgi:Zn finger protein HypA/HybF involved in hydrogenase expression
LNIVLLLIKLDYGLTCSRYYRVNAKDMQVGDMDDSEKTLEMLWEEGKDRCSNCGQTYSKKDWKTPCIKCGRYRSITLW